jgi:glyoxylase-like metal-dependent hydrolase (beta-lactamase superfamily II)
MVDIVEVAENIYMIDDQLYSIAKWGSVYLINEEEKALIDTGAGTSASTVLDGIKKIGINPEDINYLIATHIHLDHAGGAGVLLKSMPRAKVVVHYKGAKHLVNPAKLVASVIEAQGEEVMLQYGEVVPVEEERVRPVHQDDIIKLSESQVLRFIDAPGHAPHELCIYESRNNGFFSGDAVGVSVAENEVLLPVTPPPSFNLESYLDTLERLKALKASAIYFAHFGASNKVEEDLKSASDRLKAWDDVITTSIEENGFGGAAEKIRAQMYRELEPVRKMGTLHQYLAEALVPLNVVGYLKYYQEKHKAS